MAERLEIRRIRIVVVGAKLVSIGRRYNILLSVCSVLSEDDCKAGVQVPVDVAKMMRVRHVGMPNNFELTSVGTMVQRCQL